MNGYDYVDVAKTKLDFAALTLEDFGDFVDAFRTEPSKLGLYRFQNERETITNYWLMVKGFIEDAKNALSEVKV